MRIILQLLLVSVLTSACSYLKLSKQAGVSHFNSRGLASTGVLDMYGRPLGGVPASSGQVVLPNKPVPGGPLIDPATGKKAAIPKANPLQQSASRITGQTKAKAGQMSQKASTALKAGMESVKTTAGQMSQKASTALKAGMESVKTQAQALGKQQVRTVVTAPQRAMQSAAKSAGTATKATYQATVEGAKAAAGQMGQRASSLSNSAWSRVKNLIKMPSPPPWLLRVISSAGLTVGTMLQDLYEEYYSGSDLNIAKSKLCVSQHFLYAQGASVGDGATAPDDTISRDLQNCPPPSEIQSFCNNFNKKPLKAKTDKSVSSMCNIMAQSPTFFYDKIEIAALCVKNSKNKDLFSNFEPQHLNQILKDCESKLTSAQSPSSPALDLKSIEEPSGAIGEIPDIRKIPIVNTKNREEDIDTAESSEDKTASDYVYPLNELATKTEPTPPLVSHDTARASEDKPVEEAETVPEAETASPAEPEMTVSEVSSCLEKTFYGELTSQDNCPPSSLETFCKTHKNKLDYDSNKRCEALYK